MECGMSAVNSQQKRKRLPGPGLQMVLQNMHTYLRVDNYGTITTLSDITTLWRRAVMEIPSMGRALSGSPGCSLSKKEKWPDRWWYNGSRVLENGLADGQGFWSSITGRLMPRKYGRNIWISSVQLLSHVWLFVTSWTTACQASLSITNSRSLLKLMPIESVMPSNLSSSVVPFSSCPQSLPASGSFPMSQLFAWGGQSIGVSALASVLPMNTQDWSPLVWTGWISLQSQGLSRVFSNTTVPKHQFFGAQLFSQSNSHIHTWPLEKPQPWLDRTNIWIDPYKCIKIFVSHVTAQ